MSSRWLRRPAGTLLSTITRTIQPAACSPLYSVARRSHTSAQALGIAARPRLASPPTSKSSAITPWGARGIFIQTENTPNPDALKFLPNHKVVPPEISTPFIEYLNPRSTISPPYPSPLAAELMNIDGVKSVFYGPDFITVTKASDANWVYIRPEVFSMITETLTSGQPIVSESKKEGAEGDQDTIEADSLSYDENDSEVVGMIKELLETRIRPAIQEDGGDIEFRGFQDGYVNLKLRGACRTCDSSTVTLRNGIEGMLMHYVSCPSIGLILAYHSAGAAVSALDVGRQRTLIEEVKGVHQVMDQEEEIAMKEFAKFEEKLRAQKGPDAAPTTPGKDSLDSVPG
ncbi:HIRA-interacting protein 5 [Durotheca rogersii]|uniref:HIRA-interacting protein 5 n=1 Tax=Durotheca rogersii TaxID=419775 RepID=UPI00221F6803|nr:HIRA-interacting protein 5 [Durotheca rogersii]KAI5864273.1 HIRA-interacting protein 5 [Durotheca rogersii]